MSAPMQFRFSRVTAKALEPADSHLCGAFLLRIANTIAGIIATRCTSACALARARTHARTHTQPVPCGPAPHGTGLLPPRVETGKTSATRSISKAARGLPIVERRGSIVPGPHRAPCPFAMAREGTVNESCFFWLWVAVVAERKRFSFETFFGEKKSPTFVLRTEKNHVHVCIFSPDRGTFFTCFLRRSFRCENLNI